ncbi:hypothetical protein P691DRAFT_787412 [Macrolepiota fuliginosa MF-IS2]|uniref:Uncharacterized protein n=1 Tax=Macrolepiota fuliginosa MF-IS2 TaxID=1400762 RepID=A0A9P6BZT0_9AGAR|nr:hypothetical protein P691DRAFT_787412 [Macrolepiota fuliginosa MF-IS2]
MQVVEHCAASGYPVLLAADDFQAPFNRTACRDPPPAPRTRGWERKFAKSVVVGALNTSGLVYGAMTGLSDGLELDSMGSKLAALWPYEKRSTFLTEYAQGMRKEPK